MIARLQGLGWVTPLGRDLAGVWSAVQAGAAPTPAALENPFTARVFPVFRIDPAIVADVARHPRLRRSSAISHFAVAAALDAVKNSGCDPDAERLALVFASTNGGVNYTRRFFGEVSKSGTHAGSPLLFPETVYNAPASHVAALLGITGIATTIVNDATAGLDGISAAIELLESGACDRCLVVSAEEADWVLCEAYAAWGLTPVFSEGAAAVLIGADGDGPVVERAGSGATFQSLAEARRRLAELAAAGGDVLVSSAAGTRFDDVEAALAPAARRFAPKTSFGEAFAASALMQVVAAALALEEREIHSSALVPVVGFNGQVAALTLRSTRG